MLRVQRTVRIYSCPKDVNKYVINRPGSGPYEQENLCQGSGKILPTAVSRSPNRYRNTTPAKSREGRFGNM